MGKMWVVPRSVETVTQRESGEKAMSWTEPGVSPLYRVYRWWTAEKAEPRGCATIRNRWKLFPTLSAVRRTLPLESQAIATIALVCATK
jgi:hypothetical protein